MTAGDPVGLNPEWVIEHLQIDGQHPSSVEPEGFVGTGQMSRNMRIRLTWDTPGPNRPETVMVKVPSGEDGTRTIASDHGAYARECNFYRAVAPAVNITTPAVFLVHEDADARDFAIIMADLASSEQGDQFTEPTADQLALAVEQSAALQAPAWNQTDNPPFSVLSNGTDQRADRVADSVPMLLPFVLERLGDGLDEDVVTMLERFADSARTWAESIGRPTTLVHGDYRPDNFLYGKADTAPPLAVVDWQTVSVGLGPTDVGYLLAGSLTAERRRTTEGAILEQYVDELAQRGVDYPLAACRDDYALSALHGVTIALRATAVAERTERGDALFTLMLNRHGRHAIEMETLERCRAR